jgi:hypothetical protein
MVPSAIRNRNTPVGARRSSTGIGQSPVVAIATI